VPVPVPPSASGFPVGVGEVPQTVPRLEIVQFVPASVIVAPSVAPLEVIDVAVGLESEGGVVQEGAGS
jgi:hypothetical protein